MRKVKERLSKLHETRAELGDAYFEEAKMLCDTIGAKVMEDIR